MGRSERQHRSASARGGGGGTLGKAMALHMAAVLPTHSAHLICLDDQYDESIYKAKRIPVVGGSSPVPRGHGLGCKYTLTHGDTATVGSKALGAAVD